MMNDKLTLAQRKIVREIRRLHARKEPLHLAAVKCRHPRLLKALGKIKPFWGWKRALRAAGIKPPKRRGRTAKYPDANAVIAEIRRRAAAGWPLTSSGLTVGAHRDRLLYPNGYRIFGSWPAAIHAAGLESAKVLARRPYPDAAAVVAEIQRRAAAGLPLRITDVALGEHRDLALFTSSRKYFDSWPAALGAAGFDATLIRLEISSRRRVYPDRAAVVAEIQRRTAAGLPVSCREVFRGDQRDSTLFLTAMDYFGCWVAALQAAGLDPDKVRRNGPRYPDAAAVVTEIQRRAAAHLPLTCSELLTGKHREAALYTSAGKHFGSWPAALKAAGLDVAKVIPSRWRYPDAATVVNEIQRRAAAQLPLTCFELFKGKHRDAVLHRSAGKHFGSWPAALKAAGRKP